MNDNANMMPELTRLDGAAAAQWRLLSWCWAMRLLLLSEPEKKVEPVKIDESMLTEAERKMVDDFSKIDRHRRQPDGPPVRCCSPRERGVFL